MDDKPFLTMKEIQEMTTDLRDGQVSEDCPFLHQQDDSHSIPHEECISQDLPQPKKRMRRLKHKSSEILRAFACISLR